MLLEESKRNEYYKKYIQCDMCGSGTRGVVDSNVVYCTSCHRPLIGNPTRSVDNSKNT